ncbi:MAG: phosphatidylglycerol---prolipoprotein diacylglyceryl transferase, partial [Patescibacteria group bacterium]|nr:phosphatidylglycerol---prolipoprotein diacylglyceryl transferase [Patescibacteria group bacterium]
MITVLSEFTIGGITFHTYGVIIAVAIAATIKIAELHLGKNTKKNEAFWDASVWMLVGAGLGSRLWHVITDWHLYSASPIQSIYIWRGGLSIIGALIGVILAAWLFTKKYSQKI